MRSQASAPGKAILCGEHAVVYGRPAIAIPLSGIRAQATVKAAAHALTIISEDLASAPIAVNAADSESSDALGLMAGLTMQYFGLERIEGEIRIRSAIPIASGLGSGAAVSAALGRAIALLHGTRIPDADLNRLVFEVEKLHHGTPSGIDNTVVVFEMPVCFVKGAPVEFTDINMPLLFVLADTGIASPTRDAVANVRSLVFSAPTKTEHIFDEIGAIVFEARDCLERGETGRLGQLLTANHRLLQALSVSSPELDDLVKAALAAGARGAKLSGSGRGGNIIALVDEGSVESVKRNLLAAGASRVTVSVAGQGLTK